ncbi:MAG: hypothetical protein NUW01_00105 [Gemmatimonadaceae bacterium]|nr:hypothetical protein [Gemmatimonadaceae bacterium]
MTTDEEYERLRASVGPIVDALQDVTSRHGARMYALAKRYRKDPDAIRTRTDAEIEAAAHAAMLVVAQEVAKALREVNSTCPEDRQEVLDTTLAAAEALVAQVLAKGEGGAK